jgi:cytoskeleton protein RodZ|tara:strand:+ start:818 stop:1645 length:828 start_codon:yes stop_codon:yes gene_type:complete
MSKNPSEEPLQQPVPEKTSPGEILRRTRRERGLSIEDVTGGMGITKATLNALENDDFDRLPSPLFVKGYVKTYCALLGLPDQDLLVNLEQSMSDLGIHQREPAIKFPPAPNRIGRFLKNVLPMAAVTILIVIALLLVIQVADRVKLPFFDSGKPLLGSARSTVLSMKPAMASMMDQEVKESGDTLDKQDNPQTMTLNVTQQSWVEVFDASGDLLLADLQPPGTRLEVTGDAPFKVNLGYAQGVEIHYGGKVVPVSNIAADNTAFVSVGLDSDLEN